jgi:hypothetical protein
VFCDFSKIDCVIIASPSEVAWRLFDNRIGELEMNKLVAVKKLHKILGKGFGYRENPKAGTKEDREKAKAELKIASAERQRLNEALNARSREILKGDAEYQSLLAAYREAGKRTSALSAKAHSYRVTVGNTSNVGAGFGFFLVKAEGDNWAEVLEKVTKN